MATNLLDLINRYHNTLRAYNGQGEQLQRCWSDLKQAVVQSESATDVLHSLGYVYTANGWIKRPEDANTSNTAT